MEDVDYPDPSSSLASEASEIEGLKAEVLVHSARASNLHTRLLHAFDILDESQRNHAREFRDLEKKYIRLERRYYQQTAALHTCAAEKDDLRESVFELVEKVEQSNDIRSWPFNRLQLTRSAGSPRQIELKVRHSPTQEQLSYAGAIIERLRRERDEERVEHVLTREALQSRIDALEARLARRETELEYYNTHAAHHFPALSELNHDGNIGSTSSKGLLDSFPQAMTNEDIIQMLNTTAARNRTLEVEIKTLFKRLHEARSLPFSPEAASSPLPPGHQIPVHSPLGRGLEDAGTPTPTPTSTPGRSDVFSPRSERDAYELNSSSMFTPTPLPKATPLSDEVDGHDDDDDDDIIPDSWPNLSPTRDRVSAEEDINSVDEVDDGTCRISLPDPEVLGVHDPRRKSAIIAGMDAELEELTAQIDAFRLERESLTRMVAARREYRETQCYGRLSAISSSSGSHDVRRSCESAPLSPEGVDVSAVEYSEAAFEYRDNQDEYEDHTDRVKKEVFGALEDRLSVVEGDCIRLREELSECRTRAETREKELLVEIQDLQRRVEELSMCCRMTARAPFLPDEDERALFSSQGEYRGAQSDGEHLIDDNPSLFGPSPILIPDKEEDDLLNSHFREPMVGLVSETGQPSSRSPSAHSQSEVDVVAHLSPTSGLKSPREPEDGLRLDDSELEKLLDVIDGEASMVLATPLIPSSLLDRDSSDGSTEGGAMVNGEASCDGMVFDCDIDQDRGEEEMDLEGRSERMDYDKVEG